MRLKRYFILSLSLLLSVLCGRPARAQNAAADSLVKALPKAKDNTAKLSVLSLLAAQYYKAGQYPLSLQYSRQALALGRQLGNKEAVANQLLSTGKSYQAMSESKARTLPDSLAALSTATKLQRAHYYLATGIDAQKELNDIDLLQESFDHLSRVQLLQGDTVASRESFRQYNAYLAGVYNNDNGHEAVQKDMKEVFARKQDELRQEEGEKRLALQKDLQLKELGYEYEKKQALAQNEEERQRLRYEDEMSRKQIAAEFEHNKMLLQKEKEKNDAIAAITLGEAEKERKYMFIGMGMLALLSIGMANRFTVLKRNRRTLEEKNRQIAAEKEAADQQRVRAERSERFKQQFLANMSHEIRTPMNAVSGMTQLLLDKQPRPDQAAHLQVISKSSDILLHIINDILDLSKIEAGKMELESIDFSLSETIAQVRDTLAHRADEKGLQLMVSIEDGLADVLVGDPYRLNQVLINLGGNAIKFTERGSVQFVVKQAGQEGDHVALHFSIVDTGVGIPADKVHCLFDSFSQVNSSDTRRHGGTGLGLSISRQLIELHGGAINVESEQGSGTTFSFTLNYKKGSPQKLRQRIAHEHAADGSMLNGLRILVADDNEYNRLVVAETLQLKADVVLQMAVNGEEAIAMMKAHDFDVILMDVQMPVMNGIDATCFIREHLPSPKNKVPIIALTASILRADIDRCLQCGMNSYVPKPFKMWQLISTIADVTGRKDTTVTAPSRITETYIPPVDTGTVTDSAYLHKFCEGDELRIKKYVRMYLDAVPLFTEKLAAAAQARDHKEIALRIHAFKPNWMIMGMRRTGELGAKIEQQCAEHNENVFEHIEILLEHTQQSVQELS